jgi:hypothetical protein
LRTVLEKTLKVFYVLTSLMLALSGSGCSEPSEPDRAEPASAQPGATTSIPAYPDIASLSSMIQNGGASSAAIVDEMLARAKKLAHLNVFITLDAGGAAEKAKELDRMQVQGKILGPLHGIPLVVKDNIHVAGMPNTAGTPSLKDFVPTASNTVVARLEAAGARDAVFVLSALAPQLRRPVRAAVCAALRWLPGDRRFRRQRGGQAA